jgi:hypothetical protein
MNQENTEETASQPEETLEPETTALTNPLGITERAQILAEYFKESIQLEEEAREADPERYNANQHWVNNPLITPINKIEMLAEHDQIALQSERERILKAIEENTTVIPNPQGEVAVESLRITVERLRLIVEGIL